MRTVQLNAHHATLYKKKNIIFSYTGDYMAFATRKFDLML